MRNESISLDGKVIANNIRAERNRAHLTQKETAKKLNVTSRTYITYEEDARSVKATTLNELANIFGCNINDFYVPNAFTKCEEKE